MTRRDVLLASPIAVALAGRIARGSEALTGPPTPLPPGYPLTTPEMARRIVGLAHAKLDELKPLVNESPTRALAAVDWGFGDWETALAAASHTGRRDIAEFLISHGARPDVFTFAMLGNLGAVRAMVEGAPGLQRTRGPHGITLLAHAKAGGDTAKDVVAYLESLGDADPRYRDEPLDESRRKTLIGEYAFTAGDHGAFIVNEGMGGLTIKRGEAGTPRRLFHQGNLKFHPAGAPNVIVQFTMGEGASNTVRVTDGIVDTIAASGC